MCSNGVIKNAISALKEFERGKSNMNTYDINNNNVNHSNLLNDIFNSPTSEGMASFTTSIAGSESDDRTILKQLMEFTSTTSPTLIDLSDVNTSNSKPSNEYVDRSTIINDSQSAGNFEMLADFVTRGQFKMLDVAQKQMKAYVNAMSEMTNKRLDTIQELLYDLFDRPSLTVQQPIKTFADCASQTDLFLLRQSVESNDDANESDTDSETNVLEFNSRKVEVNAPKNSVRFQCDKKHSNSNLLNSPSDLKSTRASPIKEIGKTGFFMVKKCENEFDSIVSTVETNSQNATVVKLPWHLTSQSPKHNYSEQVLNQPRERQSRSMTRSRHQQHEAYLHPTLQQQKTVYRDPSSSMPSTQSGHRQKVSNQRMQEYKSTAPTTDRFKSQYTNDRSLSNSRHVQRMKQAREIGKTLETTQHNYEKPDDKIWTQRCAGGTFTSESETNDSESEIKVCGMNPF